MPHPNFREDSIILGCPALGRQQMPMFGDIRYITFTRQTWLQDRFPCHVGLLAELCSNPEAYHLQQTLTIVWDHLLFTSEFRASSWPLHTFSSGVLTQRLRAQVSSSTPRVHPCDSHTFAGPNVTVSCVKQENGKDKNPAKPTNLTQCYSKWRASFQGQEKNKS